MQRISKDATEIDVYYHERRRPRELAWSGDGFQVFLQLLYHLFRLGQANCIVLDEPDVYLHPDLQRRLYQVLETHQGQVIFATHSSELVAEVPPDAVVWIDRARRRAVASPDPKTLEDLSKAIGSGFNLRLARVLRSKAVLFVEGGDATILRLLARTLNASQILSETSLAVVPLGGMSNRRQLESFGWVAETLLQGSVKGYVLLDRDYRTSDIVVGIENQLRNFGLIPHVWRRKELESYLLMPAPLARLSGAEESWIEQVLDRETNDLKNAVYSRAVSVCHAERIQKGEDVGPITLRVNSELDAIWGDPIARRWRCPAKDLIATLNRHLELGGYKTLTSYGLAREISRKEIASEVRDHLTEINAAAMG